MALSKIFKIKKNDFAKIFSQGETVQNSFFFIRRAKTALGLSRFAVTVPKNVSAKATVRNKIRRRVYAVIRKNIPKIKTGVDPEQSREGSQRASASYGIDTIILVRPKVKDQNFSQLESSLTEVLKKAKVFLD